MKQSSMGLIAVVAIVLCTFSSHAVAQISDEPQTRGPRFLLASLENGRKTVLADVSKSPTLRQRLTLDLDDVTIKRALAIVTRQSGLELVYSDDLLPADARVTLRADGIALAAALTDILLDANVDVVFARDGRASLARRLASEPVAVVGTISGRVRNAATREPVVNANVTLDDARRSVRTNSDGSFRFSDVAPGDHRLTIRSVGYVLQQRTVSVQDDLTATIDIMLVVSPQTLDQVIVTGTIVETAQRAVPTAVTVITAAQIEQRGITSVEQLFRGDVPGLFLENQGTSDVTGGVKMFSRGSTSLENNTLFSAPLKTYVDGIEMADPRYLNSIDPKTIERIEILAGPQASTIYGSGALGGVMQVFTKKGLRGGRPRLSVNLAAGSLENNYDPGSLAPQHDHSVRVEGGGEDFSYNVGGSFLYTGPWTPGYFNKTFNQSAGLRRKEGPLTVDATLRLSQRTLGFGFNQFQVDGIGSGLFAYNAGVFTPRDDRDYSTTQQTLGVNVAYAPYTWWQHRLTVGTDRNQRGILEHAPRFLTASDSLRLVSTTEQGRTSTAYSSTLRADLPASTQATLVLGADHWRYLATTSSISSARLVGTLVGGTPSISRDLRSNRGYYAQTQIDFGDAVFLTGGLRIEDSPDYGVDYGLNYAPRYGIALVQSRGAVTAKLRAAYGKATRPPESNYRLANTSTVTLPTGAVNTLIQQNENFDLGPEHQSGTEGGVEIYVGTRASLVVTLYNQIVRDVISQVFLQTTPFFITQFQNLGDVRNRGSEWQGMVHVGPVQLQGTHTITHSRILALSPTYTGLYAVGRSLRGVAERVSLLRATTTAGRTTAGVSMSFIGQTRGQDNQAATARFFSRLADPNTAPLIGGTRVLFPSYQTVDGNLTFAVTPRTNVFVWGRNLTNYYRNDENNLFPTIGRSIMAGVRWNQ